MGKELRDPFACDADQRIDSGESQMSYWAGLILGQIPHSKDQRSSQMPGVYPGGMDSGVTIMLAIGAKHKISL